MKHLIVIAVVALFAGCAPKKIMLFETFVPGHDKVARAAVKPVAQSGSGKNAVTLSNYSIQICDISAGQATQCKTNLILENLTNYQFVRSVGR